MSKRRKRRGNGEGNTCRRADGRYVGQCTLETPGEAETKRKTVYGKMRPEAAAKLRELFRRGTPVSSTIRDGVKPTQSAGGSSDDGALIVLVNLLLKMTNDLGRGSE